MIFTINQFYRYLVIIIIIIPRLLTFSDSLTLTFGQSSLIIIKFLNHLFNLNYITTNGQNGD